MLRKRSKPNSLSPPPIAETEPQAAEVLRLWSVPDGPQEVTLRTTWDDPIIWGLLLVDVARHAAAAYAREGMNPVEVLARIQQGWDAEWTNPTDEPLDITSDS